MPREIICDILVTWISAGGVVAYFVYLYEKGRKELTERRALFLFLTIAALLVLRGFFWLFDTPVLSVVTFVPATLIPLAVALYIEGMLRRHLPFGIKVAVSSATLFFFLANLGGFLTASSAMLIGFMCFFALSLATLAFILIQKKNAELALSETQFIESILMTAIIAVPLVVSDFREEIGFFPVRMGGLGALILVYSCVRSSFGVRVKRRILVEWSYFALMATLLAIAFSLAGEQSLAQAFIPYFVLSLSFVLVSTIFSRLYYLRQLDADWAFQTWLQSIDVSNKKSFVKSVLEMPMLGDAQIFESAAEDGYNPRLIVGALKDRFGGTVDLSRLKKSLDHTEMIEELRLGTEQIVTILTAAEMTSLCLISEAPLKLLLLNTRGNAAGGVKAEDLTVIGKLADAIPASCED